jgi:hypothetical protein
MAVITKPNHGDALERGFAKDRIAVPAARVKGVGAKWTLGWAAKIKLVELYPQRHRPYPIRAPNLRLYGAGRCGPYRDQLRKAEQFAGRKVPAVPHFLAEKGSA